MDRELETRHDCAEQTKRLVRTGLKTIFGTPPLKEKNRATRFADPTGKKIVFILSTEHVAHKERACNINTSQHLRRAIVNSRFLVARWRTEASYSQSSPDLYQKKPPRSPAHALGRDLGNSPRPRRVVGRAEASPILCVPRIGARHAHTTAKRRGLQAELTTA